MQPTQPPPPPASGQRSGYVAAPPTVTITRSRPWLIGLAALVVMVVLIASVSNQGVTDAILRSHFNRNDINDNVLQSFTYYGWRFGPLGGHDLGHFWLASLVFDASVLVLTLLLAAGVVRGRGAFGHVFLGVWMSVIVATQVSTYVRGAIVDPRVGIPGENSKPVEIMFSNFSANSYSLFVSLVFGFVTAIVAALVGVLTRKTQLFVQAPAPDYAGAYDMPVGAPAEAPVSREPWTAPPAPVPGPVASPSPWTAPGPSETAEQGTHETAVLPAAEEPQRDDSATTEMPRAEDGEQHTTELPREQ
jgi:hypothetical protein